MKDLDGNNNANNDGHNNPLPKISLITKIFIFTGFLIVVACIVFIVAMPSKNDPTDKFAMYDPDNPAMAADSMSVLYRKYAETKSEIVQTETEKRTLDDKLKTINSTLKVAKYDADQIVKNGTITAIGSEMLNKFAAKNFFSPPFNNFNNKPESPFLQGYFNYTSLLRQFLSMAHVLNTDRYLYSEINFASYNTLNTDSLNSRKIKIDSLVLSKLPNAAVENLTNFDSTLSKQILYLTKENKDRQDAFNNLQSKYFKSRFDIRKQAITWGILAFTLTAVILYCVGAFFRERRTSQNKELSNDPVFLQSVRDSTWISVYMITVLLLIITIFILGLAGLLQENSLAALLGGIAGYVLNNKVDSKNSSDFPRKPDVSQKIGTSNGADNENKPKQNQ